jgi:hypothetical protein
MRLGWRFAALAAWCFAIGCSAEKPGETSNPIGGTGGGGGGSTATDGSVVKCTMDPRVDTYTANLKKAGQRSMLTFTLVESTPAPPARGTNVMKLKVTKMDDTPVTGDLTAKLTMPDHGHPTSVQPVITFDAATSTYTIDPAYLFMPGVWLLQFSAFEGSSDGGTPLDTGAFYFCIEG